VSDRLHHPGALSVGPVSGQAAGHAARGRRQARSLIERTWRAAQEVDRFDAVYVATDDDRIAEAAKISARMS
jgi:siroheme synthase (precorrin-2 oxidase/ferrochelatase)